MNDQRSLKTLRIANYPLSRGPVSSPTLHFKNWNLMVLLKLLIENYILY